MKFTMKFKKETKRTAVYESSDLLCPTDTIYVTKAAIAAAGFTKIPPALTIEVQFHAGFQTDAQNEKA